MTLSYACRILCFVLCGAGVLQVALEGLAWGVSGLVMSLSPGASARRKERQMFLLALGAHIAPYILLFGVFVPVYMRKEDNPAGEQVGFLSIVLAAVILTWFVVTLLRVWSAMLRSTRYLNSCRSIGQTLEGIPVRMAPGNRPLLAVAGIFSPTILLSHALLDESRFPAPALQAALAHEVAHAKHHDNFKLLLLRLFPHIGFRISARASLEQQWRLYAELAADEQGTGQQGGQRAILLAEMLLSLAREKTVDLSFMSITLLSRSDDLRIRVEHLLGQEKPSARASTWHDVFKTICAVSIPGLAIAVLVYVGAHGGHQVAEFLLHLGS
jgi:beta-lactamase regulating signal transducer with metallopeptidase domain